MRRDATPARRSRFVHAGIKFRDGTVVAVRSLAIQRLKSTQHAAKSRS
jgi:hypothetical protein